MGSQTSKVVVVSAGSGMALFLRLVLEREGYAVDLFGNPGTVPPGVLDEVVAVVVDLELAGVPGSEALLSETEQSGVPVVVLTGGDGARVQRETGAAAAVEKPFDASQLTRVIHEVATRDGHAG